MTMRGADLQQDTLFSTVNPKQRAPRKYPLRPIWLGADKALHAPKHEFDAWHADLIRDSIPPKKLLQTQLLMTSYAIRSKRRLAEQINYNLLFDWNR